MVEDITIDKAEDKRLKLIPASSWVLLIEDLIGRRKREAVIILSLNVDSSGMS